MPDHAVLTLPAYADQFLLRDDIAFLNHGSFGACPAPVFKTFQDWQLALERQPVEFLGRRFGELMAGARAKLAAYLGTTADALVYVPNATYGVNIVARSLDLQPGDEVLGSDHEYGAAERSWRFVCERAGARYLTQPIAPPWHSADEFVDQLWQGVTERTRVIFLSHITSPTALIFPLAAVCRRARAAGIMTVIDGAHAPGQLDLALDELGADFYTGNCHKWMCAPKSAGFLHARPERQALLHPLIVSWGWRSESPSPSQFVDYFEWRGTHDPAAYLSVPAAIDFMTERNWPAVRAAAHELLLAAEAQILELSDKPPLSPPDQFVQLRTIPLPPCDLGALKARLWDEHKVEVPMVGWNGGHYLRVSVQCYNSPRDIDRLIEGLKASL